MITQAHALSHSKWHEVLRFDNCLLVFRQKSLWPESLWFLPVVWVHVHGVKQRDDVSILGNGVPFEGDRPENLKNKSCISNTFELGKCSNKQRDITRPFFDVDFFQSCRNASGLMMQLYTK